MQKKAHLVKRGRQLSFLERNTLTFKDCFKPEFSYLFRIGVAAVKGLSPYRWLNVTNVSALQS